MAVNASLRAVGTWWSPADLSVVRSERAWMLEVLNLMKQHAWKAYRLCLVISFCSIRRCTLQIGVNYGSGPIWCVQWLLKQ